MYPCSACGACCRRVDKGVENLDNTGKFSFPYKFSSTGVCEKLTLDNKCSVYASRPLICNIDRMIKVCGLPKEETYDTTKKICNFLMDQDKIENSFRIK